MGENRNACNALSSAFEDQKLWIPLKIFTRHPFDFLSNFLNEITRKIVQTFKRIEKIDEF